MRGRRGSRSAAVVLAGCVGLAVMAPGLALAAEPPSSTRDCVEQVGEGYVYDTATGTCQPSTSEGSGSPSSAVSDPTAGSTTTTTTPQTPAPVGTTAGTGSAAAGSGSAARQADPSTGTATTPSTTTPTASETPQDGTPEAAQTDAGVNRLQAAVDQSTGATDTPAALLPPDALDALKGALGFDIPTTVPAGGFDNAQQSCAFLASQLKVPSGVDAVGLAGQLGQFCKALPATALDPTTLTGLIQDLIDLLKGLIPSLPSPPATIPSQPPHTVSAVYWGYWYHHYDVDCPELTYEEANAILAGDPSDPFRLDGDHDGVACEENAHRDGVAYVEYVGYPVGGVATGDGSTGTGASGVEVALAAATLAGLGLSGLVLVRRFARQG